MPSSGSQSSSDEESYSSPTRVAQQLRTLQSLLPNNTQTDERSILEDTRDYLNRIHQETEQIEKELSQAHENPSSSSGNSGGPIILGVETEKVMDGRFVVKILWRRGSRGAGHVQRVIECLDVKMTSIVVNEANSDQLLTTAFVKVKKEAKMREEDLQDLILDAATRFGLLP